MSKFSDNTGRATKKYLDATLTSVIENTNTQVNTAITDMNTTLDTKISEVNTKISEVNTTLAALPDAVYTKVELAGAIGNINSPLLDLPLNNSLAMKQGVGSVTFSRSTKATYIDRYGVLQTADIDEPRFEKDGLLIEGSSTNLKLHSKVDDFNSAKSDIDDDSIVSPTGGMTGSTITCNEDGAVYLYRKEKSEQGQVYTASYFVKDGNTDGLFYISMHAASFGSSLKIYFDLNTCQITSTTNSSITGTITELADGWFRLSATATTTEDNTDSAAYLDILYATGVLAVDDYFYVWGAQLEKLPFATSYIPTTDSAVTRGADSCVIDRINNFPTTYTNKPEITVALDFGRLGLTGESQVLWSIYQSAANYVYARGYTNDYRVGMTARSGTVTNIKYVNGSIVKPEGLSRMLVTMREGLSSDMYIDGSYITTFDSGVDNHLADFSEETQLVLGSLAQSESIMLFGHIKNFRIYNKILTATEVALA